MTTFTRRRFLRSAGAIGCSLAAHPLVTPMAFAAAPGESRLVVIILRGGMDGLDTLQPIGDTSFAMLRGDRVSDGAPLTDFYALNDGLASLRPMWDAGQLAFVQAVSTPYRDKRSHFDGQDLLEAGTGMDVDLGAQRDGWLNRLLQTLPGAHSETAYAVGQERMKILEGAAPAGHWSPETRLGLGPQARLLLEVLYEGDPLFHAAAAEAMDLAESLAEDGAPELPQAAGRTRAARRLAAFAADRLNHDSRIAAFSIGGWDTHRNQSAPLSIALERLAAAVTGLKEGLGPNWDRTTVLAMTEFGRTARINGSGGTDHGTGGLMIAAGGAVRGGRIYGDWPGLGEADLYDRRDLMPTRDVRSYAAHALRGLFGTDAALLQSTIFPGLDLGDDPRLIL